MVVGAESCEIDVSANGFTSWFQNQKEKTDLAPEPHGLVPEPRSPLTEFEGPTNSARGDVGSGTSPSGSGTRSVSPSGFETKR